MVTWPYMGIMHGHMNIFGYHDQVYQAEDEADATEATEKSADPEEPI